MIHGKQHGVLVGGTGQGVEVAVLIRVGCTGLGCRHGCTGLGSHVGLGDGMATLVWVLVLVISSFFMGCCWLGFLVMDG